MGGFDSGFSSGFDLFVAGDALLKIQSEVLNLSDSDLKTLGTPLLKLVSESANLSESDLKALEAVSTGHTGWGIPIGIP